jgi:hypothetical protein
MKKILSVLVFIGIILMGCGSSTPEERAKEFIQIAYSGDGDKLMSMIYIPENAQAGTKEMVTGKMKMAAEASKQKAEKAGGIKNIESSPAKIDGDRATVSVAVTFQDGKTKNENVRLIKIKDNWLISI